MVPAPTIWKMMVTVPASRSKSATVRGMRSESSFARTMMNWPGCAFFATSGASITSLVTVGFSGVFSTILNISFLLQKRAAHRSAPPVCG